METTVSQRIMMVYKLSKSKSINSFAVTMGIPPTTLKSILNGSEPRYGTLKTIIDENPSISSEWLLTGEGSMLKNKDVHSDNSTNYSGVFNEPIQTNIGGNGNRHSINRSENKIEHDKFSEIEKENTLLKFKIEMLAKSIEDKERIIEEKERMIKTYEKIIEKSAQ